MFPKKQIINIKPVLAINILEGGSQKMETETKKNILGNSTIINGMCFLPDLVCEELQINENDDVEIRRDKNGNVFLRKTTNNH